MGAYLSEPIRDKQTESGKNEKIEYASTTMQGWRVGQEDAHNCILEFENSDSSLFGVYDGHGGAEVSAFTSKHFPEFLSNNEKWKSGDLEGGLIDGFLEFDHLLLGESAVKELRQIAGIKMSDDEEPEDTTDEKRMLYEEAQLPLEELLKKYGVQLVDDNDGAKTGKKRRKKGKVESGKFMSPPLRAKTKSRIQSNLDQTSPNQQSNGCHTHEDLPDISSETTKEIEDKPTKRKNSEKVDAEADGDAPPTPVNGKSSQCESEQEAIRKRMKLAASDDETNCIQSSIQNTVPTKSKDEEASGGGTDVLPEPDEVVASAAKLFSSNESPDSAPSAEKTDSDAELSPNRALTSPSRRRSSKSESEVRLMRKEAEATGPITNWKMLDNLGNDDPTGRSTGTPETATAVSSSEEDSEDDDFKMDASAEAGSSDEDALDSSSSVDPNGSSSEEDEEESEEEGEDEEEEEEEEEAENFPVPSGDSPGVDSGTTACVAVLKGTTLYVANAGDSRCIISRGGNAIDLSVDHKPEDEIERTRIEKAGGKITGDGRVNGGLNLSRAIGDHFYKRTKGLELRDQMISALPDIRVQPLEPNDEFLILACDGIWNSMTSQEVVDFTSERIKRKQPLSSICEELCDHCLAPTTDGDGTGCDNMTVIIIDISRRVGKGTDDTGTNLNGEPTHAQGDSTNPNAEI